MPDYGKTAERDTGQLKAGVNHGRSELTRLGVVEVDQRYLTSHGGMLSGSKENVSSKCTAVRQLRVFGVVRYSSGFAEPQMKQLQRRLGAGDVRLGVGRSEAEGWQVVLVSHYCHKTDVSDC